MRQEKYKIVDGHCVALRDFGFVRKGETGGLIETEGNLSQWGDCWVFPNANVCGGARVNGDARVSDRALIRGNAIVAGNARICGQSQVYGSAIVSGNAILQGECQVYGKAQVFGGMLLHGTAKIRITPTSIVRSDGYTFIYVPCADGEMRVLAGCRYFTMEQALAHWKKARKGTRLGNETLKILAALESIG
jgi:hypothetical protein